MCAHTIFAWPQWFGMSGWSSSIQKARNFQNVFNRLYKTESEIALERSSLIKRAPQSRVSSAACCKRHRVTQNLYLHREQPPTMELRYAACVEWSGRRSCWGRKADGIQNRDVQTGLEHGVSLASGRKMGWLGAWGGEEEARPGQGPSSPLQEGVCRQGGSAGRGRDALHWRCFPPFKFTLLSKSDE